MISHNKELMFSGELCTQETHIPWTAFLSYPNSNAPLHPLTCSLSQPPLLESQSAVLLQGSSRCHWLPIPTNKWAWEALVGSALTCMCTSKGASNPAPCHGLDWNTSHYTKTTAQEALEASTLCCTLSALCFWTCVKKPHYFTSPEKKSTASFGICLHTSSTVFSALWW